MQRSEVGLEPWVEAGEPRRVEESSMKGWARNRSAIATGRRRRCPEGLALEVEALLSARRQVYSIVKYNNAGLVRQFHKIFHYFFWIRTTYRRCIELCLCEYYSFAVHTVQHQKHLEYCSLHQSTVRCSMTSTPIKSLVDSDNHSFAVMFTVLLTIQSIRHCVGLRSHRGMDIRFE